MKRVIPLVLTFFVGLFMVGEFFIPHWRYRLVTADLLEWGLILAAGAYLLGLINLIQVNLPKIINKEQDWHYKVVMLLGLALTLVVGFMGGEPLDINGETIRWSGFHGTPAPGHLIAPATAPTTAVSERSNRRGRCMLPECHTGPRGV